MDVIIPLVVGGLMAWLGSSMAAKRNRSELTWAIVCFCLGLIGVAILACMGKSDKPTAAEVDALESIINKEGV